MKIIFALAAAVILSSLTTIAPANAQKDPACMEKCNRENKASGGSMPVRGEAQRVRACIAGCPKAGAKAK
jgi:hypothetical protein